MDRILEIDTANLCVVTQPGVINATAQGRGRRARPVLRARSGELRDVLDRRQPGHERRRAVLREVRPDPRLACSASRSSWPTARSSGRAAGTSRTWPGYSLTHLHRGLAGDARDHHRGDAPPAPGPAAPLDAAGVLPDARIGRRRGRRDGGRGHRAGDARAHGPVHDRGRRRHARRSGSIARRRRCSWSNRTCRAWRRPMSWHGPRWPARPRGHDDRPLTRCRRGRPAAPGQARRALGTRAHRRRQDGGCRRATRSGPDDASGHRGGSRRSTTSGSGRSGTRATATCIRTSSCERGDPWQVDHEGGPGGPLPRGPRSRRDGDRRARDRSGPAAGWPRNAVRTRSGSCARSRTPSIPRAC